MIFMILSSALCERDCRYPSHLSFLLSLGIQRLVWFSRFGCISRLIRGLGQQYGLVGYNSLCRFVGLFIGLSFHKVLAIPKLAYLVAKRDENLRLLLRYHVRYTLLFVVLFPTRVGLPGV